MVPIWIISEYSDIQFLHEVLLLLCPQFFKNIQVSTMQHTTSYFIPRFFHGWLQLFLNTVTIHSWYAWLMYSGNILSMSHVLHVDKTPPQVMKQNFIDCWALKDRIADCPKTTAIIYQPTSCNIPHERRRHVRCFFCTQDSLRAIYCTST
jgi:hypothetical protein